MLVVRKFFDTIVFWVYGLGDWGLKWLKNFLNLNNSITNLLAQNLPNCPMSTEIDSLRGEGQRIGNTLPHLSTHYGTCWSPEVKIRRTVPNCSQLLGLRVPWVFVLFVRNLRVCAVFELLIVQLIIYSLGWLVTVCELGHFVFLIKFL